MFDVFISYKSQERPEALYVKNFLQANGISCWMDQDQIEIGQDYKVKIAKVMPKCIATVLLLSYASQASKEVTIEYEQARENHHLVFPILIEDCKLTDYYDKEMRHTQVAKSYWKSDLDKQKTLFSIRDQIYEAKGEPVKTEEDFLTMRIEYYQKEIDQLYRNLDRSWDQIVMKSVERCGFMTPEPHYIKAVITEELLPYQQLVGTYITDIVIHQSEKDRLTEFYDFIVGRDIIRKSWLPYAAFRKLALKQLTYLGQSISEYESVFILRIYKDYLLALSGEEFAHPIVRLAKRLKAEDAVRYELFMSQMQNECQPSFIHDAPINLFVSPRYIGKEYINIGSEVYTDDSREVFEPESLLPPQWSDFLLQYSCDELIGQLTERPGASTLTTFFVENSFFSCSRKLNSMYFYLINRLIETGHPEYVKVLLRNFGKINWNAYVSDVPAEIGTLKRFYLCCMRENGYEFEYALKVWREA